MDASPLGQIGRILVYHLVYNRNHDLCASSK
jgi:hypothetical protein